MKLNKENYLAPATQAVNIRLESAILQMSGPSDYQPGGDPFAAPALSNDMDSIAL